jgi:hypothetical protein
MNAAEDKGESHWSWQSVFRTRQLRNLIRAQQESNRHRPARNDEAKNAETKGLLVPFEPADSLIQAIRFVLVSFGLLFFGV